MFRKILKKFRKTKTTQENVQENNKQEINMEHVQESFNAIRNEIIRLEALEPNFEIVTKIQRLKSKLNIPIACLKEMDGTDICFYALNSESFKSLAEYTESVTPEIQTVFEKLTSEEYVCKYSMEDSVNLIYFYGNLLSHEGIINLVYNIIDKCHGDMGVYTTIVKNLAELKHIEGIEIIYSAITFKYGEEVAKRLMNKLGIEVDFSKLNKVL